MGILHTGLVSERKSQGTGHRSRRHAILTQRAFHWFKKRGDDDLFGEEKGCVPLNIIAHTARNNLPPGNEPDCAFLGNFTVETIEGIAYIFETPSVSDADEWAAAILTASIQFEEPSRQRRPTLSGIDFRGALGPQVAAISLACLPNNSISSGAVSEVLLTRATRWGKVVLLPKPKLDQELRFMLREGGVAVVRADSLVSLSTTFEDLKVKNAPNLRGVSVFLIPCGFRFQWMIGQEGSFISKCDKRAVMSSPFVTQKAMVRDGDPRLFMSRRRCWQGSSRIATAPSTARRATKPALLAINPAPIPKPRAKRRQRLSARKNLPRRRQLKRPTDLRTPCWRGCIGSNARPARELREEPQAPAKRAQAKRRR